MTSQASAIGRRKANSAPEQLFGEIDEPVRPFLAVMQKAESIFGTKIAEKLAVLTRSRVRTAEYWRAGRQMSFDKFVLLLNSEEGFAFLEAALSTFPEEKRAEWWKAFERGARMSQLRRDLEAQRAELAALELALVHPSKSRR